MDFRSINYVTTIFKVYIHLSNSTTAKNLMQMTKRERGIVKSRVALCTIFWD